MSFARQRESDVTHIGADEDRYGKLSIGQARELCKKRGIVRTGKLGDLLKRLRSEVSPRTPTSRSY
jgi:hypothetical protein